jgi:2-dehydropantoate 2-reductase
VKAHGLTQLAPQLAPLIGEHRWSARRTASPGGISRFAGEFRNLHLERVDPGGVIADPSSRAACSVRSCISRTDIAEPGVIRHNEGNRISLGEPDGSRSERAAPSPRRSDQAGLRCPVTTRIRHEIWVKLLGNVAFNPISALTRATLVQMVRDPEVVALVRSIMAEVEAVAAKLGIELSVSIDQRIAGAEKVGEHKTSMLQDLEAGRPHGARSRGGRGGRIGRAPGCRHAAHAQRLRLHQTAG